MAISFHQYSPKAQAGICLAVAVMAFGAAWQVLISPERAEVALRLLRVTSAGYGAGVQTCHAHARNSFRCQHEWRGGVRPKF